MEITIAATTIMTIYIILRSVFERLLLFWGMGFSNRTFRADTRKPIEEERRRKSPEEQGEAQSASIC